MTEFVVGKQFPFPVAGIFMLRLMGNQLNVVLNFPDPTKEEQETFQDGDFSVGIYLHSSGNAFFLAKIETNKHKIDWMDVPINFLQNSEEDLKDFFEFCRMIEGQNQNTAPMALFLIDANTQILKQMRMVGPPTSFLLKIRDIFQMQKEKKIQYNESMIHIIYGQMTSEEMANKAQERMVFYRKDNKAGCE